VGQLVVETARRLGLPPPVAPTDYANATIADVAEALESLARTGSIAPVEEETRPPAGVDLWIRSFSVELVERLLPQRRPPAGVGAWHIIAPDGYPLADPLRAALARAGGGGVVVCLPPNPDERHVGLLLEGARITLAEAHDRFVLVQHGGGAAAFARTLHLEHSEVTTCIVDVPADHPQAIEWVVAEAMAAVGYAEAHYDSAGRRREPLLRLLAAEGAPLELPLGPDDVLLVTGGGKGITAECALALAQATGCCLALLGRSQPAADAELAANLDRMAAAGISLRYVVADVTDAEAVRSAVRAVETDLGPVTGILHGAARNVPRLLHALDEGTCLSTLAPKIQGLRSVLAAIDPGRLRLLVSFGSIIACMGLPGEADYALANEWLTRMTERFQAEHPGCRCLAVEWSIWSDVGMGARLGGVGALARAGITPIPPDAGVAILRGLLARRLPAVAVVVTGRFGEPSTLQVEQPDLPFLRFLERRRVYYPGVELIVDAELSTDMDPYLDDHIFQGERILPAVMGLEAMAQAAMALAGMDTPPIFEEVTFSHPIVVSERAPTTIRLAALAREPGCVEVALRSRETAFQIDCFRATCRFATGGAASAIQSAGTLGQISAAGQLPPVGIDPDRDLYGGLLFHRGRFQRVRGYQQLSATGCVAEIGAGAPTAWFGHYLPPALVLGDPGARDAAADWRRAAGSRRGGAAGATVRPRAGAVARRRYLYLRCRSAGPGWACTRILGGPTVTDGRRRGDARRVGGAALGAIRRAPGAGTDPWSVRRSGRRVGSWRRPPRAERSGDPACLGASGSHPAAARWEARSRRRAGRVGGARRRSDARGRRPAPARL
jgi:enediyne polyketide synthase